MSRRVPVQLGGVLDPVVLRRASRAIERFVPSRRRQAHKAASWGTFQILGENHKAAGHATIKSFVDAMNSGAAAHLDAFVSFILANRLDGALCARNWPSFARGYNGPAYAQNACHP
jgi:hypothetical protein